MTRRKRACIVHNSMNITGGGERLAMAVLEALKELGYQVTLITTEPTNWEKVDRVYGGRAPRPDEEFSVLPFPVRTFGIYMRLLTALGLLAKRKECDLTINTHGDVLPVSVDVVYMHFPTFAILRENPASAKYSRSLFWRAYFAPYEFIQSKLAERRPWLILLTNSEYSRDVIRKYVGQDAIVLYPPVRIEEFLSVGNNDPDSREDIVVSCGRFTPEKRHEFVLMVAEHLPDVEFHIVGASSGKVSPAYISRLRKIIEEKRLHNVVLHVDYPRSEQVKLYSRAKVYLHSMIGEHFGIAVVEAMAAGLVPVVHMSGGPWNDIVYMGRYGYGYKSLEEAIDAIHRALKNYRRLRPLVVSRAREFSYNAFKDRFKKIIEIVYSTKQKHTSS